MRGERRREDGRKEGMDGVEREGDKRGKNEQRKGGREDGRRWKGGKRGREDGRREKEG